MAKGKRTKAAHKGAGVKAKITTKQRNARKKNIAIARRAKPAGKGKLLPKSKEVAARNKMKGGGTVKISMKEAVTRQLGRRKNTAANRKIAKAELNKAIAGDKAKRTRRAKERAATPEAYSKRKRLRKQAEMVLMKKMRKM